MTDYVPTSIVILREEGPLSLREVTRRTAMRMNLRQMYADVDAVLRAAQSRGEVIIDQCSDDFRERVWRATGAGRPIFGDVA